MFSASSGRAAHRVHVAERVRRGDRAVLVGVVDDGREEVGGDDQRPLGVQPVDGSVIGRAETNQQIRVIRRVEDVLNGAQNLRQGLRGQLRRSTGAG